MLSTWLCKSRLTEMGQKFRCRLKCDLESQFWLRAENMNKQNMLAETLNWTFWLNVLAKKLSKAFFRSDLAWLHELLIMIQSPNYQHTRAPILPVKLINCNPFVFWPKCNKWHSRTPIRTISWHFSRKGTIRISKQKEVLRVLSVLKHVALGCQYGVPWILKLFSAVCTKGMTLKTSIF